MIFVGNGNDNVNGVGKPNVDIDCDGGDNDGDCAKEGDSNGDDAAADVLGLMMVSVMLCYWW